MVFVDPLYSHEEIDFYRCEILEKWFQEDKEMLAELIDAYEELLRLYEGSENIALYRYKLACFLHLDGNREDALSELSQIQNSDVDTELDIQIKALLESLREGG